MIKTALLPILRSRLRRYGKFMTCKPVLDNAPSQETVSRSIRLTDIELPTLMMLSGFWYEKQLGQLAYVRPKKHIKVDEVESILKISYLDNAVVPIPCTDYQSLFDCDVRENIVYELWAPRINPLAIDTVSRGRLIFFSPDVNYVRSFSSLVKTISVAVKGSEEAYVYAVSKFSYPGFLGRFLESFSDVPSTKVIIASSNNTKEAVENKYSNVKVVYTRSHRKIMLILARMSKDEWEVLGFHGSMNVFAPGVDDYLVYANDFLDLTVVVHGLLRALLVV